MRTEFNFLIALEIILSRVGEDVSPNMKPSQIYTEIKKTGWSMLIVGYICIAIRQKAIYKEIVKCSNFKVDIY